MLNENGFWMAETSYFLLLGAVSAFAALLQGWPPVILEATSSLGLLLAIGNNSKKKRTAKGQQ